MIGTEIPIELSYLLQIEYHHLKACISALSIQAVIERALSRGMNQPKTPVNKDHRPFVLQEARQFIDQMISASSRVLKIATDLQVERTLRYTPLHIRNCIMSTSILLLKAISLGGRSYELKVALRKLDQCIAVLGSCGIDDLDFMPRYTELVKEHLPRFRNQLKLSQNSGENQPSGTPAANESSDGCVAPLWNPTIAPCSNSMTISLGVHLHSLDFLCHPSKVGGNSRRAI